MMVGRGALTRPDREEIARGLSATTACCHDLQLRLRLVATGSSGIAALTPQGEVNHLEKTNWRKPALGPLNGHTFASLFSQ